MAYKMKGMSFGTGVIYGTSPVKYAQIAAGLAKKATAKVAEQAVKKVGEKVVKKVGEKVVEKVKDKAVEKVGEKIDEKVSGGGKEKVEKKAVETEANTEVKEPQADNTQETPKYHKSIRIN